VETEGLVEIPQALLGHLGFLRLNDQFQALARSIRLGG
jgi:hypothetical protein